MKFYHKNFKIKGTYKGTRTSPIGPGINVELEHGSKVWWLIRNLKPLDEEGRIFLIKGKFGVDQ